MAQDYKIIKIVTDSESGLTSLNRFEVSSSASTFSVSGLTVNNNLSVNGSLISSGETNFSSLSATSISGGSISINGGEKMTEIMDSDDFRLLGNTSSSGVISFSGLSINPSDNTKFDVGDTKYWFVDNVTTPDNPVRKFLHFTGATGVTLTNLATAPVTYISLDENKNIIQDIVEPKFSKSREQVLLGVIVHSNNTNINLINNKPTVGIDTTLQSYDLMNALNLFNINGNTFTANGVNLNIDKTSGKIFSNGSNFVNDIKNPHVTELTGLTTTNFRYRLQDSTEFSGTTEIDPNNYDNAGTLTAVANNKFTIQRITVFQSNSVRIQYGQNIYNSLSEAKASVDTEVFITESNISENGLLRAFLILKKGATDLTDDTQALFISASKFGDVAAAGGGAATTLQRTYEASLSPEIVTDSTRGAVDIRAGVNNTEKLIQFENTGGTVTAWVDASGNGNFNSISGDTIYSGSTNLYDIFLTTADGNDITRVQPGSNITTGGTANDPIINVVDSPSFNGLTTSGNTTINSDLLVTGTTILSNVSATTLNADTISSTDGLGLFNVRTTIRVLKSSPGTIATGSLVYQKGHNEVEDAIIVELASASQESTMPSLGVTLDEITDTVTGFVVVSGEFDRANTSGYTEGGKLYVSPVAGEMTNVRPTGDTEVQLIAIVEKQGTGSTDGHITIVGAGKVNDLPNLEKEKFWIGGDDWIANEVGVNDLPSNNAPDESNDYIFTWDDSMSAHTKTIWSAATQTSTANNVGSGIGVFRDKTSTTLNFKTLTSTGSTVAITDSGDTINIENTVVPATNKIIVSSESGGDFQSVKAAVDSITDNSATNRYCIEIGPGIFVEDTITLKPYVDVSGCYDSTIIEVNSPNKDCIELVGNAEIRSLRLRGSTGSTYAALAVNSNMGPGVTCGVDNVIIGSTDSIFKSNITTGEFAIVTLTNVVNGGTANFNQGYVLSGDGNSIVSLNNSKTSVNSSVNDYFFVSGSGNRLILSDVAVLVQSALGGSLSNLLRISNGATFDGSAMGVDGADKVIFNENVGSGALIRTTGFNILNSTNLDIDVQHPSTSGYFNGAASQDKVNINTNNITFTTAYEDTDGGFVISGDFNLGDSTSELSNISDLILRGTSLGRYTGGTVSINSGLTIDVSAGKGYLENIELYPQKVIWSGETGISIPSNSIRYVFVDENGIPSVQTSQPNLKSKIVLGRVISDDTNIVSVNNTPMTGRYYTSETEKYNRAILGTTFNSGCVVSENTTPRKLNVSAGSFYFSNNEITPAGGDGIIFTPVYKKATAGQWNYTTTGDTVPNDKYDDGSGTLASLSGSSWVKHSFYVNGDGDDEKYFLLYGQEQFASQIEAENGSSPTAPDGWSEGITILADIVIEASGSSITTITDKRNFLGTGASGGGGGTATDHGGLTGLNDDDHTQYLLVDGTRAMTGNFDMGTGSITNVGNVDGVDVSAHASRHLPNGSDPLSTGTPSSIGTSNSEGVANAFARQDHVHNHGNLIGGTLHDLASTSSAGFLSASEKGFLTTGGTLNGSLIVTDDFEATSVSATTITGTTFYGDGSNLTGVGGGSSRITGSTQTTNATPTTADTITSISDNSTGIIETYVKAYSASASEWGVWKRTLTITKVSGTITIREENADVDKTSSSLNANSIDFIVNGGDIDIQVTGIAATTIDWNTAYEIIL